MLLPVELIIRPEGNDRYVARAPSNPKRTQWVYHDDVSHRFL